MALEMATVHGSYKWPDGTVQRGKIHVELNVDDKTVRDSTGDTIYAGDQTYDIVDGAWSKELIPTTDPTTSPTNFSYTITEQLEGVAKSAWRGKTIQLTPGQVLDLADVEGGLAPSPVVAQPVTQAYLAELLASVLATYVSFERSDNGLPIAGGHVTVKVDPTTHEIFDIVWED